MPRIHKQERRWQKSCAAPFVLPRRYSHYNCYVVICVPDHLWSWFERMILCFIRHSTVLCSSHSLTSPNSLCSIKKWMTITKRGHFLWKSFLTILNNTDLSPNIPLSGVLLMLVGSSQSVYRALTKILPPDDTGTCTSSNWSCFIIDIVLTASHCTEFFIYLY